MRFLIDAQLPPGLARWLTVQGHFAVHVAELGMTEAEDPAIWEKACSLACHLITKDEDFVVIRERSGAGPSVIWLRIGNAINRVLIKWFEKSLPAAIEAINVGTPIVEIN
jgi:predicted nuclease of predicted toxin-antitoxin system